MKSKCIVRLIMYGMLIMYRSWIYNNKHIIITAETQKAYASYRPSAKKRTTPTQWHACMHAHTHEHRGGYFANVFWVEQWHMMSQGDVWGKHVPGLWKLCWGDESLIGPPVEPYSTMCLLLRPLETNVPWGSSRFTSLPDGNHSRGSALYWFDPSLPWPCSSFLTNSTQNNPKK